jgi:hypothetical protein
MWEGDGNNYMNTSAFGDLYLDSCSLANSMRIKAGLLLDEISPLPIITTQCQSVLRTTMITAINYFFQHAITSIVTMR